MGSPSKISPPPFSIECFSLRKYTTYLGNSTYSYVKQEASKKHQRRSGTVQEEGLTNEGRSYLLLLHNQTHDKRNTVGSLHAYINRAMCEVSKFLRKISKLLYFYAKKFLGYQAVVIRLALV